MEQHIQQKFEEEKEEERWLLTNPCVLLGTPIKSPLFAMAIVVLERMLVPIGVRTIGNPTGMLPVRFVKALVWELEPVGICLPTLPSSATLVLEKTLVMVSLPTLPFTTIPVWESLLASTLQAMSRL